MNTNTDKIPTSVKHYPYATAEAKTNTVRDLIQYLQNFNPATAHREIKNKERIIKSTDSAQVILTVTEKRTELIMKIELYNILVRNCQVDVW